MSDNGKPVKLLIFIHDLAPFGAQRVALNTVKHLAKKLFSVTVCSFGEDDALAAEFREYGAEVVKLAARRYLDPLAWRRLFSLVLRSRPDIIQTNMPELSLPVRLLAMFMHGTRVFHTVQNPFSSEPWYWRFLNIGTLFLCDKVVFCSQSFLDEFRLNHPVLRSRCRVVQNGMELPASPGPGLRAELGIGAGEKVICCVARLARQKGQDLLISAVALLAGQKRNVRLLLAGDGEDLEKLKNQAAELGVAEKVLFLGRRTDTGRVLSCSDIYAAPSRWEGLALSPGEAMLAGLPCVGTTIAGHTDILKNGVTGLAVPPENAAALAAGIARLLDNPTEAGKMAAAAAELVRTEFSVEKMAKKYEELYLGLVKTAASEDPVHVLYFIHDLAPFGMQHSTCYIAKTLDKSRFRVTVCSFWGDETMVPAFTECGSEVVFLRAGRFFSPSAWLRLASCLFSKRPDIIETTMPELGVPVRLLSLFLPGTRIVHRFRNPLSSEPAHWRFLNKATLGLCDAIAFSSKGIVEEIALEVPRLKSRFYVAQNGVELAAPPAGAGAGLRRELGIGAEETVIGCVGRLVRQKGQDLLIDAAAVLLKEKRRIRLLLAGDGELLPELRERVEKLGLVREVVFLGRRSDIARVLDACDLYAAPSRWESFNIALGEAMLSGRPCVASDIAGHEDLLKDGLTGMAVPSENAGALAGAVARLLDRPEEARRMALAGKKLVRSEFTINNMVEKCAKLYLDLAERRRRP